MGGKIKHIKTYKTSCRQGRFGELGANDVWPTTRSALKKALDRESHIKEKTRDIEMYVGYCDHRWETITILIPSSTPEDKINEIAVNMTMTRLISRGLLYGDTLDEVAFVGVYHIPETEE